MTELQERRRTATVDDPRLALKERLTGAVILVALVVLLVPALLTGRRPDPPPRDAPTSGRSYEIDITGPARAPAEDPARPLPEPESMPAPVVAAAPVVTATPVTAPATGDQGVRVAPTGLPPSGGGVAPAAASSLRSVPPASRVAAAPAVVAGARAPAAPAGPAGPPVRASVHTAAVAPVPVANPAGKSGEAGAPMARPTAWAVQLGAFAGRETAAQLVATLRSRGFAAFVLEYRRDGKVLYRVRVGPEQDRERAVAIAERLNRDGYKATVAPHP